MKRMLSILLVFAVLLPFMLISAPQANAAGGVKDRIEKIRAVYPTGSYFNVSGKPCTHYAPSYSCDNCYLPSIPARGGLSSGAAVGYGAWSCASFAYYVYYNIFGHNQLTQTTQIAKPTSMGDLVNMTWGGGYNHWAIYLWQDDDNYYFYDANNGRDHTAINQMVKYDCAFSKSEIQSFNTVYHATNYDAVNGVHTHNYQFKYFFKSHPHENYYECSCGAGYVDKNSSNYYGTNGCNECRPGKPALLGLKETYLTTEPVVLKWDNTKNTTHYSVWIYKNVGGTYQQTEWKQYAESGVSFALQEGQYRVRLASYDSNHFEADHSDWVRTEADLRYFTVEKRQAKPVVTVTDPGAENVCSRFSWTSISGVSGYELVIFDGNGEEYRHMSNLPKDKTDYLLFLSPGTYKVAVVAVWADGSYQYSDKVTFTVSDEHRCPGWMFTDMPPEDNWAHYPIEWAIRNNIATGTSATTFSPDAGCTRAQVVTLLWRGAGQPEPSNSNNPFTDVKPDAYYYKAVLWAVERKITSGTTATTFSPETVCTRAQIVTFLWRYSDRQTFPDTANPFVDVPAHAYYEDAVVWAVVYRVTNGTSETTFSPEDTCTRGQVVTFMGRVLGGK